MALELPNRPGVQIPEATELAGLQLDQVYNQTEALILGTYLLQARETIDEILGWGTEEAQEPSAVARTYFHQEQISGLLDRVNMPFFNLNQYRHLWLNDGRTNPDAIEPHLTTLEGIRDSIHTLIERMNATTFEAREQSPTADPYIIIPLGAEKELNLVIGQGNMKDLIAYRRAFDRMGLTAEELLRFGSGAFTRLRLDLGKKGVVSMSTITDTALGRNAEAARKALSPFVTQQIVVFSIFHPAVQAQIDAEKEKRRPKRRRRRINYRSASKAAIVEAALSELGTATVPQIIRFLTKKGRSVSRGGAIGTLKKMIEAGKASRLKQGTYQAVEA